MRIKNNNTLITLATLTSLGLVVSANAVILSFVDFQQVEAGAGLAPQAGADIQLAPNDQGTNFLNFNSGGLDFVFSAGGAGSLVGRGANNDRTNVLPNLTQPDLHGDLWAARGGDGTVLVEIMNLNAGDVVTVTLWHNDSFGPSGGFDQGQTIDPTLSAGGALISATSGDATNINGIGPAVDDTSLTPSIISFTSDGNTAEILLSTVLGGGTTEFMPINGFTVDVVPEPSSTALLGLGGVAFMLRRRR